MVHAGVQTGGRGQRRSAWHSQAGANLLASVVMAPHHLRASNSFLLSMMLALSAADAVSACTSEAPSPAVKWPNDLWLGGSKLAGMLIENHWQGNYWRWAVGGLGLNVGQTDFPVGLGATSLRKAGVDVEVYDLLHAWIDALNKWYAATFPGLQDRLVSAYHERLLGYHQWHGFRKPGFPPFRAYHEGVAPDGHLRLRTEDGRLHKFAFKEVQWLGLEHAKGPEHHPRGG